MKKITPHLWFDKQAREAAELYVTLSPGSKIRNVRALSDTPSGDCDIVSFELAGQPFLAMSAGPLFKINPSVSFHIRCGTAEEVDAVWEKLSPGARILMPLGAYPFSARFGWLEDRYGVAWQVIQTEGAITQKIVPALLFVGAVCGKAEEAIQLYVDTFQNAPGGASGRANQAEILARYGSGGPDREGTVQFAHFWLGGQEFAAMDSAHDHKFAFNEAISFMVSCDTQEEIDYFWGKLAADPNAGRCGWLKDKYGVSWQITPTVLPELLGGGDKERAKRVTQAFLKMKKFDIEELVRAAA